MTLKIQLLTNKRYVIFLITVLMRSSVGIEADGKFKRQNLIPSARIGRELFLTDEEMPMGLPPSFEEDIVLSSSDPNYIDSEVFLSAESDNEDIEDDVYSEPIGERKKRSVSEEESGNKSEGQQATANIKSNWNAATKNDFFETEKRKARKNLIFIPRIGKKSYDEGSYAKKRVVFIPRVGKRNFDDVDFSEDKRAIFIPRIGKKSFNDVDNSAIKRAVFIPRIGKRTAYMSKIVPNTPKYRVSGRVVFIPRVG